MLKNLTVYPREVREFAKHSVVYLNEHQEKWVSDLTFEDSRDSPGVEGNEGRDGGGCWFRELKCFPAF